MKPPPAPLVPSGLSPDCPDVIGETLTIRCTYGWGWYLLPDGIDGPLISIESGSLLHSDIEVIPEEYVDFTAPRCCISGRVKRNPAGYDFDRFVAFIMSDGCDYNFTDNIAQVWRVMLGDGKLDCETDWSPRLSGREVYFGYGSVGQDSGWLDRLELESAREHLSRRGAKASVRGEGRAVFLFVEHDGRAIEIYGGGGGYTIECWDADREDSHHNVDVPTIMHAMGEARTWLKLPLKVLGED